MRDKTGSADQGAPEGVVEKEDGESEREEVEEPVVARGHDAHLIPGDCVSGN